MKIKKNVLNALFGEVTTTTTKLAKIDKFICKELDNLTEKEQKQILAQRNIQIQYFNTLIERIDTIVKETGYDSWVIYTDDPRFGGKRNYFRKYLTQCVCFTDEMPNAKKYKSFFETLKDMDILKKEYGIECFAKIII